jgi:Beta-lactamase
MGWIDYRYTNGLRLVWHTGFWDGFGAFIGFFPEEDLGLAVLTNKSVASSNYFHKYVLNLLLENRFSFHGGANEMVVAAHNDAAGALAALAAGTRPVEAAAIAPFLGYYAHGYRLAYDAAGTLRLYLGSRAPRVLAMVDGSYVLASGGAIGTPVRFMRDSAGTPVMELEGVETVRWSSAPP